MNVISTDEYTNSNVVDDLFSFMKLHKMKGIEMLQNLLVNPFFLSKRRRPTACSKFTTNVRKQYQVRISNSRFVKPKKLI